jgi:uncharacterized protein YkwD
MKLPKSIFKVFFFLLSLNLIFNCFGQDPSDKIQVSGLNEKLLEHLIKEKINEVRLQHQLNPLFDDSVLFVAAKFHAKYLHKKGFLSHTEPEDKIMETPQKRANYFGAINYLVGENIAFTLVNTLLKDKKGKLYENTTYDETATDLVTMWVNSPGHYKNIITPDYNATGLAIWVDTSSKRIYAVQKFAQILFKYRFKPSPSFFPYIEDKQSPIVSSFDGIEQVLHQGKHAFKLEPIVDSANCKKCYEPASDLNFGLASIEQKGNAIYLVSYEPSAILNLLNKRKDGFAAEIVSYSPNDCGNPQYYTLPSRRNKQCIFNGKVLKPIYKKQALRGFRQGHSKRKEILGKIQTGIITKFYLKLGSVPKKQSDYYEVNLVVLQKKRVCKILHFSSYCGDTLERFYQLPFLRDSISNTSSMDNRFRNFSFSIPFQKSKTKYQLQDIKPITDTLISADFIADTIEIKAYASIEGSALLNTKLQNERANTIANAIASSQSNNLIRVIRTEENWTLFEKQIKDNKILQQYKNLSRDSIKKILSDTLKQKQIEIFLAAQRIAKIRLHAKEIITDAHVELYLLKQIMHLKQALSKVNLDNVKPDSSNALMDSLNLCMEVSYNKIKQGIIKNEFFTIFDISNHKAYNAFNLTKLKYKLQLHKNEQDIKWVREAYGGLVNLYNNDYHTYFVCYNMLNLIQKHGDALHITLSDETKNDYIDELMELAVTNDEKDLASKLGLNFWFSICKLPFLDQPKSKLPIYLASLNHIYDYFKDKKLDRTDLNKLGAYYLFHGKADWVIELLWPEFESKTNNPKGLELLAKTLYQNYEETGNISYYEFLESIFDIVGKNSFCPMFVGPCNISFQALDYEKFRDFYCKQCGDYLNYAKNPNTSEKKIIAL